MEPTDCANMTHRSSTWRFAFVLTDRPSLWPGPGTWWPLQRPRFETCKGDQTRHIMPNTGQTHVRCIHVHQWSLLIHADPYMFVACRSASAEWWHVHALFVSNIRDVTEMMQIPKASKSDLKSKRKHSEIRPAPVASGTWWLRYS